MIRICQENPTWTSLQIAKHFSIKESNISISPSSVRRILLSNGPKSYSAKNKPYLTARMKKTRLAWCKSHLHLTSDDWKKVVFSDESYIEINMGGSTNKIRRFSFQNPLSPQFIKRNVKFPTKIMIWWCISAYGVGRLKICQESMNSERYMQTLESHLIPSISDLEMDSFIFMDDSAPCHRSKKVNDWLSDKNILRLDWPGNSPDLNLIVNVWAYMKIFWKGCQVITKDTW